MQNQKNWRRIGNMFIRCMVTLVALSSVSQAVVKVYSTVNDNRITVNQTVSLTVTAEGSEGYPQLDISEVEDFTVISGPAQSSSFHWANGRMSSSKSLSWTLIPNRTGSLTIPGLDVTVDKKTYALEPISVMVGPGPAQPQQADPRAQARKEPETPLVFLQAKADKSQGYRGEQITVNYTLYTRANLRQYSVENKPRGVGFWLEELYAAKQPTMRETRVNGVRYQAASLYRIALFPTTSGELILNPMVLTCAIEVPSRSRFPSLFDDFFSDPFFSRTKQQVVRSQPLKFNIMPVPEQGKPTDYTGAVGEYTLSSFLDTTRTEVNQAISYTIELKGTGNLNLFQLEEPVFPVGLEVFSPKTSFEKDPFRDEISGTKRMEYVLIPRKEGRFFIPQTELVHFNPRTDKWESTATEVLSILVQPGHLVLGQGQGLTKEEIALLGQDVRYIRTAPIRLKPLNQRMIPGLFWWLSLLGIVLFVSPGVVNVIRTNREERVDAVRARRARRNALRALQKLAEVKDPTAFAPLAAAIHRYLAHKMGVSEAGLDTPSVEKLLDGKSDPRLIAELIDILTLCDQAQYAPAELSPQEKNAMILAKRASKVLIEIDAEL